MKALRDPQHLLAEGLDAIRAQFRVPPAFPAAVVAAAEAAARGVPDAHADRTALSFVTLDPAGATDLDQAFAIESSGHDLVLHYAIADIAWFVRDGDAVDAEAWVRGTTTYLPDGKASLYPPVLGERAASLLPDGDRPAIVLIVRVAPDGEVRLEAAERAMIRSRAKLAYESVRDEDLPGGVAEIARRIAMAEDRRGAARVDPPEQEVERDAAGCFRLRLRPWSRAETQNSALSLAANMAVADAMLTAGTGLFRVMAPPPPEAEARLRQTARALRLAWPDAMPLSQFERRLNPAGSRDAAFMLAIRRAGNGARYEPFRVGELPWHAAVAAPYAHATAPQPRQADRHVLLAVLAIASGKRVPETVGQAFERLPAVMARAGSRDGQVERAVVDLAEAATLANREGETFAAVVTEAGPDWLRIQLRDEPVVAKVAGQGVLPGAELAVSLLRADPVHRRLEFAIAGPGVPPNPIA